MNGIRFHTVAMRLDRKRQRVARDGGVCASLLRSVAVAVVLTMSCSIPLAPAGAMEAPPNAHPERFGSGWECDRGYQKDSGTCIATMLHRGGQKDR